MSSLPKTTIFTALAGAVAVSAHATVNKVTANGRDFNGVNWPNDANEGFVPSSAVNGPGIICHINATNAQLSVPVAAGEPVEITWTKWSENHKGPVLDYLADCGGDCATVDKTALRFFKIAEAGQLSPGAGDGQPGRWADDLIIENGLKWNVTIPASIRPGNYVLRSEIIALHNVVQNGEAELYPQCVNLQVSGSGTEVPDGVAGTALYQANDAGLNYNIYNDEQSPAYKIPGPAIPVAGSSGPEEVTREAIPFRA
ncbi:putative endoglucanase IV precursor [Apiospora aurea]|uniref:lytic cellulose monooxygenase (C4-dehydrogenating) n=1 Tax=Apiospora aurea TaxID=335848 RepID=A0ABR1QAD0_9PEZI